MYCATCGTPLAPGLSFCNRCGTSLNKERAASQEKSLVGSLITAVVLVAMVGLGTMCGGAIALKNGAELKEPGVVLFMVMTFVIVALIELFLLRQVSRVIESGRKQEQLDQLPQQPLFQPALVPASEVRAAQLRTALEPVTSVTENTTRTLEHSFRPSLK
jgi:predicted nucleic acid-binding Zn ribbon protein